MKTIKALADELGVSKTAIRKHLTEEIRAAHTENLPGNVIGIDDEGCKLIAESLRKPPESFRERPETTANQFAETAGNQGLQSEVDFLRQQIAVKDSQIAAQQDQIAQLTVALDNTTAALQAAQALHAGTMGKLLGDGSVADQEQQKPRWKFWK